MTYEKMTDAELTAAKEKNKLFIKDWERELADFDRYTNTSSLYYFALYRAIKKAKTQNHRIKAELLYRRYKSNQGRV